MLYVKGSEKMRLERVWQVILYWVLNVRTQFGELLKIVEQVSPPSQPLGG